VGGHSAKSAHSDNQAVYTTGSAVCTAPTSVAGGVQDCLQTGYKGGI